MNDKIIRIYPEKEPEEGLKFFKPIDAINKYTEFHNPYSSRQKYKSREERFFHKQAELFSHLGITYQDLSKKNHDIREFGINTFVYFNKRGETTPPQTFDELTAFQIFGKLLYQKGKSSLYHQDNKEFKDKLRNKKRFFQEDQLYLLDNMVVDIEKEMIRSIELFKKSLTESEIAECTTKSIELYNILEFSIVHYEKLNAKKGNFRIPLDYQENPLYYLLDKIVETGAKLDYSRFKKIKRNLVDEGTVEWFEDIGYAPEGMYAKKILLNNYSTNIHKNLIKIGDTVRFSKKLDQDHGEYFILGNILEVIK